MDSTIKLVSFNCKSIKRSVQDVRDICKDHDIVALQETWLLPHDLNFVNEIDDCFSCTAKSSVDTSAGTLRGRPYGGLSLMWRKSRFPNVSVIECDCDRIAAMQINDNSISFLVLSIYMPTDDYENLSELTNCLAKINAIIEERNIPLAYILGDFNAHPGARFGKILDNFCKEEQWVCADIELLGESSDTFTYISEINGAHRWLDHCVTTSAAWRTVISANVICDVK